MVETRVHQHHPADINYSLEAVEPGSYSFAEEIAQLDHDAKVIEYDLPGGKVSVLYTAGVAGTADDIADKLRPDQIEGRLESMDSTSQAIALWLLNFFAEMHQEVAENGDSLSIYKEIELEKVPEGIRHVDWGGSATDVAGSLMSNLILRHALPNANHRTGVTMAQAYLEASGADFDMPATTTEENDWREWVEPYILESKRLLTVRRHNLYFKTLAEYGCEVVRRKDAIDIPLEQYELDMGYRDAWVEYAKKHEQHCTGFVEDIAKRGNSPELIESPGLSEQQFVAYLRTESEG